MRMEDKMEGGWLGTWTIWRQVIHRSSSELGASFIFQYLDYSLFAVTYQHFSFESRVQASLGRPFACKMWGARIEDGILRQRTFQKSCFGGQIRRGAVTYLLPAPSLFSWPCLFQPNTRFSWALHVHPAPPRETRGLSKFRLPFSIKPPFQVQWCTLGKSFKGRTKLLDAVPVFTGATCSVDGLGMPKHC